MIRKFTFGVFAAAFALLASCNKAEVDNAGDIITLNCSVSVADVATKAIADGSAVDRLACAVYEGENLYAYAIVEKKEGKFNYAPSLYYGKKYDVVFFAYKDGSYAMNDGLTAITPTSGICGEDADAFRYKESVMINADGTLTINDVKTDRSAEKYEVTLSRPFAQLNIGTSIDDMNAVGAAKIQVSFKNAASYSAFANTYTGTAAVVYTSTVSTLSSNTFSVTVDGVTASYNLVSLNYLFATGNVSATITILKEDESVIRTMNISNVPLIANKKTNLFGDLVKGELTFNVSVSAEFTEPDNNKTVDE